MWQAPGSWDASRAQRIPETVDNQEACSAERSRRIIATFNVKTPLLYVISRHSQTRAESLKAAHCVYPAAGVSLSAVFSFRIRRPAAFRRDRMLAARFGFPINLPLIGAASYPIR